MAKYYESLGECKPDNLVAGIHTNLNVVSGTFTAGAGNIKRGTVIALTDGALSVYGGTEGQIPYGVLCENVNATDDDVVAEIYITGHFNKNALIVADGYTLSEKDVSVLRDGGILIENSAKM